MSLGGRRKRGMRREMRDCVCEEKIRQTDKCPRETRRSYSNIQLTANSVQVNDSYSCSVSGERGKRLPYALIRAVESQTSGLVTIII